MNSEIKCIQFQTEKKTSQLLTTSLEKNWCEFDQYPTNKLLTKLTPLWLGKHSVLVKVSSSLCCGFEDAGNFSVKCGIPLHEILILSLELGLNAGLLEFLNRTVSLLFKEKAKNYCCYLEFSQIIISENENRACVIKMDLMKKEVFLHSSDD